MSWADVDYDGQQECAVAYYYSAEGNYHVARLDVSGTNLVETARFDDLEGPLGFADVNVDGYPDLYVLNMQGDDRYYENVEGKRFVDKTAEYFPISPWEPWASRSSISTTTV